jgi:hypothetical protein
MTVHRKYTGDDIPNSRLVSILQVERIYHTHEEYYNELVKENRQAKIPSNCLVEGNLPHLFAQTTGEFLPNNEIKKYLLMGKEEQLKFGIEKIRLWDKTYQRRVKRWPMLIKTDAHFMNLYDPSPIFKTDFQNIFNTGVPLTLRPMKIEIDEFIKLCSVCGIKLTVIDFI